MKQHECLAKDGCKWTGTMFYYRHHIKTTHNPDFQMKPIEKKFNDWTAFQHWRNNVVCKGTSLYFNGPSTPPTGKGGKTLNCCCSGFYKPSETAQKTPASIKINGYCPAQIFYKLCDDGSLSVDYYPDHFGHEAEEENNDKKPLTPATKDPVIPATKEQITEHLSKGAEFTFKWGKSPFEMASPSESKESPTRKTHRQIAHSYGIRTKRPRVTIEE